MLLPNCFYILFIIAVVVVVLIFFFNFFFLSFDKENASDCLSQKKFNWEFWMIESNDYIWTRNG